MFEKKIDRDEQLKKDKHTILEGYVTENLYYKQFLENSSIEFSKGWWYGQANFRDFYFVLKDELSDFDREIIKILGPENCFKVTLDNKCFKFIQVDNVFTSEQFKQAFNLKQSNFSTVAEKGVKDIGRQEKCIEYFEKNNIDLDICTERYFANDFLSRYFYSCVNIDVFQKNNGKIEIVEIKFKTETNNDTFGINVGQYNVFKKLVSKGMNLNHFILYKDKENKDKSIFEYINDNEINKYWIYSNIDIKDIKEVKKEAPKKTNVYGKKAQQYYEIKTDKISNKVDLNIK